MSKQKKIAQVMQPVPTDVGALVDKNKQDAEAKKMLQKEERKAIKQAVKEQAGTNLHIVHDKKGNGSKTVNSAGESRGVTKGLPESFKGLTTNLKEAKRLTAEQSTTQRRPLYINVQPDGSFDFSGRYDKDSSLHCFSNGAEVAMVIPKKNSAPTKENKSINNQKEEQMEKGKKTAVKADKKVAAKKVTSVSGKAIEKTVAQVLALIKAGKEVWTSSGKNKYNAPYLSQRDKSSTLQVIVK